MYPSTTSSLFALITISFINYSQESPASNISLFLFVFFCLSLYLCKWTQPQPIGELRFTASGISANQKPALNAHGQIHSGTSFGSYIVHLKQNALTMRMLALTHPAVNVHVCLPWQFLHARELSFNSLNDKQLVSFIWLVSTWGKLR